MDRDEARMFFANDCLRVARARPVAGNRSVQIKDVRSKPRLKLVHESRSCERANHLQIVRREGAPILGDQVMHSPRADAHRPTYAAHRVSGAGGTFPKSGDSNILAVPVPAAQILVERIEGNVLNDAVFDGPHAGEQSSVGRISDGRQNAANAFGMRAFAQNTAKSWNLQAVLVGGGH